mmetsp:Transcript_25539/g.71422  ORF Transcript_25539/g.71422 Transcript_25539/m.71422 type:complete len:508 (-) Transcript_25539:246-1769(-)
MELTHFQEVGDAVVADIVSKSKRSTERVRASFLVAADGAKSSVRKNLGLDFPGHALDDSWVVAHCRLANLSSKVPRDSTWVVLGTGGLIMGIPLPEDTWEVIINLREEEANAVLGKDRGCVPTESEFQSILRGRGLAEVEVKDCQWISPFQLNSRQVPRYSAGRVFMMGDACHVHSPVGGQGMNYGMQDAFNLSWKLAAVLRGDATSHILESYTKERHMAGKLLVSLTDLQTRVVTKISHMELPELISSAVKALFSQAQQLGILQSQTSTMMQVFSQTTISYAKVSQLVLEHWELPPIALSPTRIWHRRQTALTYLSRSRVVAGDRAPNASFKDGTSLHSLIHCTAKFTVLLFEAAPGYEAPKSWRGGWEVDTAQTAWALSILGDGLLQCVTVGSDETDVQKAFGVRGQCLYLVRPDGYTALRSQPISRTVVSRFLTQRMGLKSIGVMSAVAADGSAAGLSSTGPSSSPSASVSSFLPSGTSLLLVATSALLVVNIYTMWNLRPRNK